MAGKLRFAAKLVLGTTVLASGGTGAYYYTTGGGWPSALASGRVGTSAEPAAADLDAVASAWAAPTSPRSAEAADFSPTARSADVTLARTDTPTVRPPTDDRYGVYAQTSVPVAAVGSEPIKNVDPEPTPMIDPPSTTVTEIPEQTVDSGAPASTPPPQSSTLNSPPSSGVTRGQEPKGEANASVTVGGAEDRVEQERKALAEAADSDAEPQPLTTSSQEPNLGAAARRAREAFRDRPSPTVADRYGAAASAPARGPDAATGASPRLANPFAASTNSSADPSSESLETVPALPGNDAGNLAGSQDTAGGDRSVDGNRTASAADDGRAAEGFRVSRQPATLGGPPDSDRGELARLAIGGLPDKVAASLPADGGGEATGPDGTGRPGERALEGPQQPALMIQKFAPGEIQVGKPAKFVVQVRNVGGQAADQVVIRDEVPHGTRLVSSSPTAESDAGQLIWQLGKLSPGEERTVEMQLMPTAEGEIGSVATVSYSAQASVKTRCTMPQLAIRMTAPEKVMIGQEQRVKIELRNPGSGDATGVMLFENVPQNVRHAAGPALEFEIGTLRANETRELELVLRAEKAGKVLNVLTARGEGSLQVQQQVEFEVIAPGLSVDVSGPERRYLERPATYEVIVENPGTAPAHDVQLVTKLPKGLRFVRANNLGEYDAATHTVYWSLAELPEGERGSVELVAMPIETGPQTLEVEGRAGQGLSDQTQQQILVEGLAAIMFEVRDLEDPIEVGGETGYEIRIVNQGTKATTNVQVTINLPPGMQVVSADGETGHQARGNILMFEPLAQLAPKADTLYRIQVQGTQAGDQRVTVEVNTDDLGQPIRREESTRVFGDE